MANTLLSAFALQRSLLAPLTGTPKRKRPPRPRRPTATVRRSPRPKPGSFIDGRYVGEGGELAFKLYTPLGSARRQLPIVVMLHGCTQTAAGFAAATRMNGLADERGFLVLYPEQSPSANMARCWNWHLHRNQERGGGEPARIAALTRQIIDTSRADPRRVYIAGLSAGGAAAAITAAAYPDLFVAAAVHSGLARGNVSTLSEAMTAMRMGSGVRSAPPSARPVPLIVFHGDEDRVVHPGNAEGFLSEVRRGGRLIVSGQSQGRSAGGRAFTRTIYRSGEEVLLENWTIHGSGHGWSGGSAAASYTDPAGPDASREMVRFFLARRRSPPATARPRRSASLP